MVHPTPVPRSKASQGAWVRAPPHREPAQRRLSRPTRTPHRQHGGRLDRGLQEEPEIQGRVVKQAEPTSTGPLIVGIPHPVK